MTNSFVKYVIHLYYPHYFRIQEKNTVQLLEGCDVFVDRTALCALIQKVHQKVPLFLLKKLLPLVFSTEELANSCGQGLVQNQRLSEQLMDE